MGDLLIRDIPESLKRDIAEIAKRNGRSLSEETKRLLQRGLSLDEETKSSPDVYAQFRQEFASALLTDDEHDEMMSAIDNWKQESVAPKSAAAE